MADEFNILKVRDDISFLKFNIDANNKLIFIDDNNTDNNYNNDDPAVNQLINRINPWLTALFQAEHLSLLLGSGLTCAVSNYLGVDSTTMGKVKFKSKRLETKINEAAKVSANLCGRGEKFNFEDQIRVANELLRGEEIYPHKGTKTFAKDLEHILNDFAGSILTSEGSIISSDFKKLEEISGVLVDFLMSFASRSGTHDRLNIFTTNYDRLIEFGAELAGLRLIDRFVGSLVPIFRASRLDIDMHYNPPGIRGEPRYLEGVARFTKLHGSIDWIQDRDTIRRIGLPFGAKDIKKYLDILPFNEATANKLMIYPNAAKDRETAMFPYVELFRDFAAAICRPNNTLVTYGYSFGDEHINRVINDMLTIPSTHLVIISYNDQMGRIIGTYNKLARKSQISLLLGKDLADIEKLTKNYLPTPNIDKVTYRMAELLQQRNACRPFKTINQNTPVVNGEYTNDAD